MNKSHQTRAAMGSKHRRVVKVGDENGHYVKARSGGDPLHTEFLHATKGWRRSRINPAAVNLTSQLMKRLDRVERIFATYGDDVLVAYIAVLCWIAGGYWARLDEYSIRAYVEACRSRWGTERRISRRDATIAVLLWLWKPATKEAA